jgi:type IV pilus assembly protein PilC
MASFTYVAMEPSGKKLSGQVTAADKDSAMALIAAEGRFVVEIRERGAAQRTLPTAVRGRVDRSQLALFTRRMADLAAAGLPLDRVLRVVSEQSESPKLTQVANLALEDIRNGLPVSVALSKYPRLFPPLYTQTLGRERRAGSSRKSRRGSQTFRRSRWRGAASSFPP